MSVFYKNKNGEVKKIASNLVQRINSRWFLCSRTIEDGVEYYTVPYEQVKNYYSAISPTTIYNFGFRDPNTTTNPKLRFNNTVYDIIDLSNDGDGDIKIGQLSGVFSMFTQESNTAIYLISHNTVGEPGQTPDTSIFATKDYVNEAIENSITSALGGSY